MRLQQPSYIFFRSCFQQERAHWQNTYYSGILEPPTCLENIKALMKDSLILVSTTLTLYRLCNGSEANKDLTKRAQQLIMAVPLTPGHPIWLIRRHLLAHEGQAMADLCYNNPLHSLYHCHGQSHNHAHLQTPRPQYGL